MLLQNLELLKYNPIIPFWLQEGCRGTQLPQAVTQSIWTLLYSADIKQVAASVPVWHLGCLSQIYPADLKKVAAALRVPVLAVKYV